MHKIRFSFNASKSVLLEDKITEKNKDKTYHKIKTDKTFFVIEIFLFCFYIIEYKFYLFNKNIKKIFYFNNKKIKLIIHVKNYHNI